MYSLIVTRAGTSRRSSSSKTPPRRMRAQNGIDAHQAPACAQLLINQRIDLALPAHHALHDLRKERRVRAFEVDQRFAALRNFAVGFGRRNVDAHELRDDVRDVGPCQIHLVEGLHGSHSRYRARLRRTVAASSFLRGSIMAGRYRNRGPCGAA